MSQATQRDIGKSDRYKKDKTVQWFDCQMGDIIFQEIVKL